MDHVVGHRLVKRPLLLEKCVQIIERRGKYLPIPAAVRGDGRVFEESTLFNSGLLFHSAT